MHANDVFLYIRENAHLKLCCLSLCESNLRPIFIRMNKTTTKHRMKTRSFIYYSFSQKKIACVSIPLITSTATILPRPPAGPVDDKIRSTYRNSELHIRGLEKGHIKGHKWPCFIIFQGVLTLKRTLIDTRPPTNMHSTIV